MYLGTNLDKGKLCIETLLFVASGPNNNVVLNKRASGIFWSHFMGEIACWWENFKLY